MRIAYWVFTILAAALMTLSAIPDVLVVDGAVQFFEHLGYPRYLLPFLGVAKLLGVAAILQPWSRTLKEWAYAGLIFDLIGAFYSHMAVGDPPSLFAGSLIGLVLVSGSCVLLRLTESEATSPRLSQPEAI
jgi:hypothetical protein